MESLKKLDKAKIGEGFDREADYRNSKKDTSLYNNIKNVSGNASVASLKNQ